MTERPMTNQRVSPAPLRYVLVLCRLRVDHMPYPAIPRIVPSRTIQSSAFTRTSSPTTPAARRKRRRQSARTGKRNATCAGQASRCSHRSAPAPVSFPERNQIGEQSVRPWHAVRQLAEKVQACVSEIAFAILRDQQAALLRRFTRIIACKDRCKMFLVPLVGKINTAFLHPAVEIALRDSVRRVQSGMFRREESHLRIFIRHAI